MLVIEVPRFGGPEVLVAADSPDPSAGPGELVVAVTASDVMFLDTMIRSGRGAGFFPIRPPYVPGNGVAGRVMGVGDGVDAELAGRPVIAHTGGPGGGGGYAEQAVVKLDDTVLVPDGLDLLTAAAVIHDGPTALRIVSLVDVRPGERVLILGAAGGMGILLVQLLRSRGARVIGAARGKAKVDAVSEAGADVVVDYGQPDWASEVAAPPEELVPPSCSTGSAGSSAVTPTRSWPMAAVSRPTAGPADPSPRSIVMTPSGGT